MKYSCIPLGAPSVQEHLAFLEKELNNDFSKKQLVLNLQFFEFELF